MLEEYIENNPWIKKSDTYISGEYKNFEYNTIPKINLGFSEEDNNLSIDTLIPFLDFWKLHEPYPNKIYLYVKSLSKKDKESIKNNHLKELIKLGINDFSIKTENLELLIYLLENNFLTNITALSFAVEYGKIKIVEFLVENNLNIITIFNYSLTVASSKGYIEVVKYLVKHGADIHYRDDSALKEASLKGHLEVVKCLIENGANIYTNDNFIFKWPSKYIRIEIAKYLVNNGADINKIFEIIIH